MGRAGTFAVSVEQSPCQAHPYENAYGRQGLSWASETP